MKCASLNESASPRLSPIAVSEALESARALERRRVKRQVRRGCRPRACEAPCGTARHHGRCGDGAGTGRCGDGRNNHRTRPAITPVTVGTAIASCPPYRSVRAELPHTAPTLDEWCQIVRQDKDARSQDGVSIVRRPGECVSSWADCVDYDGLTSTAIGHTTDRENAITLVGYQVRRDIGSSH